MPHNPSGRTLKQALIPLTGAVLRWYFRRFPIAYGKVAVWDKVVRRVLIWRHMQIVAPMRFGALIDGRFPDLIHSRIYIFGVWEPGITWLITAHLRAGDTMIDIGANVGVHTLLAAHLAGTAGKIIAIEASPTIYQRLVANLQLNDAAQVQALNVAVSDTPGRLTVFLAPDGNLGKTTTLGTEAGAMGAAQEAEVEAQPLPNILTAAQIRAARLIKIDVEGAEWRVLQGMRDVLAHGLAEDCIVLVEVSTRSLESLGGSVASVIDMFRQGGREPRHITNHYDVGSYVTPPRTFVGPVPATFDEADIAFARPEIWRHLERAQAAHQRTR
jgi:FkbM family methyltransferase